MKVLILKGDGIGPEIMDQAKRVLDFISMHEKMDIEYLEGTIGGAAIDNYRDPYPEDTKEKIKAAHAVLLGAVGGPKWESDLRRPEQGLLELRKDLDAFCNIRPIKTFKALSSKRPLKDERNIDLCFVRELTGGIYFGKKETYTKDDLIYAKDEMTYNSHEIKRISHIAFEMAANRKNKVTLVDKSNVLDSSKLWRKVVHEEKASIEVENMYVDNAAMQLILNPNQFDVILTSNMFGDILSDEASVLAGSIGCLPSISMGTGPILYEPIHGSAPDIAGKNIANPIGMILSVAHMFEYTMKRPDLYQILFHAIETVLDRGIGTIDLSLEQRVSTSDLTDRIINELQIYYETKKND